MVVLDQYSIFCDWTGNGPAFMKLDLIPGTIAEKLRRVDWLGNVISIAATTSGLIPITWGGVEYSWDLWHTLVPRLIGVAGLI